jgi:hypothetical protein
VVTSVVALSDVSGSAVEDDTVAVFEMDPAVPGAVTVIVNCTLSPLANDAAVHVIVPLDSLQPVPAETNATVPGSVSTTLMLLAVPGPLFVAASVYVRFNPAVTDVGLADLAIARSALSAFTVVTSVVESLEDVRSTGLAAETVAVFEIDPGVLGAVTVMVNWTFAPLAVRWQQTCTYDVQETCPRDRTRVR